MLNSSSISKQPSHSHIKSAKVIKGTKGNWILTKTIGKGSMGKVKLAINETTKEKVRPTTSIRDIPAANHYKNLQQDQAKEFRIIREAAIMLLLDHPYIVTLHEILLIDQYYYFVFDLVSDGQMLDFIISHGKLKEKVARKYLRQIVSAVDYCHQNSIVHRDLKIENILIDKEGYDE
ncbi:serine/threonine-protein kinase KIN2 [Clydaea vesicula]|uniref:Serine/threonine-protein kinase KIN2 n=1 Tax=Clydaea vesicula TaxID=447962 RepID=A0AAD5U4F6_9FUNG|nr:serine/threonine-protein kinase KIN2 [Clydaea vesicula]